MKKTIFLCCLLFATSVFAQCQSAASPVVKPVSPISALEWLVGGVWTADISKMGNGMKSIETRYTWSDNKAFLRFNTHFISEKGTKNQYDGNFYFDPARKSLNMWYADSENTIYQGPISVAGDTLTFDFRGEDFEGKMSDLRVRLNRKSDSLYNWTLFERDGDKWKQLATLDYLRNSAAAVNAQAGAVHKESSMGAVTGVGGAFIRSKDPKKLYDWYSKHLGIPMQQGSFSFPAEKEHGMIAVAFFPEASKYFPTSQPAMLDFQVDDLDAIRARLISEGVDVDPKVQEASFGRFGWFTDPEGNRVELWQPL
jgi:predicted enzyme related to lactoylglutathione lyase